MLKIRDPLGLIEKDPELRARVWFLNKVVIPICVVLIFAPMAFIAIVVLVEAIKNP